MHRITLGVVKKIPSILFFVVLSLAACSDDRRSPGGRDGGGRTDGGGRCTEGEIECRGREAYRCVSGEQVLSEACAEDQVCAIGIGCAVCQPGRTYCDGREVRECDDSGETFTVQTECPAHQACRSGSCIDACAVAASERSNVGCDYMAVDLDNEFASLIGTPPAQEQFAVVLANPSMVLAHAQVFQSVGIPNAPGETFVREVEVPAGGLVRIDLDNREVDGSTTTVEGPGTMLVQHAYRIRTNFPVVAYQFNPIVESASNDASLLLPVPALDTRYRVIGWPTANPITLPGFEMPGIPDHSYVTIVGTEAGTNVRVTLGGDIVAGEIAGGGTIPARSAGEIVEMTIGAYDVLNLESDGIPGDMTGTIVESSAPVAVFSGGERAIVGGGDLPAHPSGEPEDFCCTEHVEEQVFPTSSWGKEFVVTRSPVRTDHPTWREPDVYRVLADANGTSITTNLPAPFDRFSLSENEWVEFHADRSFVLTASEPVSIQQMLVSQGWVVSWKSGHGGDPSMILFPPYEQYRADSIVLVPETFSSNYVVISVPEGTTVTLDGEDLGGDEFMRRCAYETAGSVGGSIYTAVTCPVEGGTHRIVGTNPVGVMVYGYHSVGSYGYAGGSNLTQINLL